MDYDDAKEQIKADEALRLSPYRCSEGKLTIGWGWNLDDNPIPLEVAELLFEYSFEAAKRDATKFVGPMTWSQLDVVRRGVLINMAFNLGYSRLSSFRRFREHLQQGAYDMAADEMVNSKWYRQVTNRAKRLVESMRSGQ